MIAAIVLAAGKSTRMGRTKALLPLGDRTFLARIVDTLRESAIDDIVVVLGQDAERVRTTHESCGARFVVNPRDDRGQFSSLLVGLDAIARPGVEAALWTLVDVPLVSATTVRAVIDRYRVTNAPLVRPVSGTRHGHPVLVDAALFEVIRSAPAEFGAKPIVRAHASAIGDVAVDDEGAFLDVDTPAEYERATAIAAARR